MYEKRPRVSAERRLIDEVGVGHVMLGNWCIKKRRISPCELYLGIRG